jgi:hypothetical protein
MGLTKWNEQWQRDMDVTFYQAFRGHSAALCGTGPSLEKIDPSLLDKDENLLTVCLNNAFKFVNPNIWVGLDSPDSFDQRLWVTNFLKFYNRVHGERLVGNKKIKELPGVHLYQTVLVDSVEDIAFGVSPYMYFMYEGNTFSVAMGMLDWMGIDTVYLVGCDLGGSNAISKMRPKKTYNSKNQKRNLDNTLSLLKSINAHGRMNLISCTPSSPINKFLEYTPLEEL